MALLSFYLLRVTDRFELLISWRGLAKKKSERIFDSFRQVFLLHPSSLLSLTDNKLLRILSLPFPGKNLDSLDRDLFEKIMRFI